MNARLISIGRDTAAEPWSSLLRPMNPPTQGFSRRQVYLRRFLHLKEAGESRRWSIAMDGYRQGFRDTKKTRRKGFGINARSARR